MMIVIIIGSWIVIRYLLEIDYGKKFQENCLLKQEEKHCYKAKNGIVLLIAKIKNIL